jgi:protein-L-isoaspartate(D-aspartate) O-methyltransferase
MDSEKASRLRAEMVEHQLRRRGIRDERVLAAMGLVPRELFLPQDLSKDAYTDSALPIASGQTISQPYIVAIMTELLGPHPGMRILEVGTGSGYQAAVLAAIGCQVISIERHEDLAAEARASLGNAALPAELHLADRVRVEVGDGSLGRPADAPYEGILVTAAAPRVPPSLCWQLEDAGRLVLPVGPLRDQILTRIVRHQDRFEERGFGGCVFVPLIGGEGYGEEVANWQPRRGWRFWL